MKEYRYTIGGHTMLVRSEEELHVPASFDPFVRDKGGDIVIEVKDSPTMPREKIRDYEWFQSVSTLYRTANGFQWERVDNVNGGVTTLSWEGPFPKKFILNGQLSAYALDQILLIAYNYGFADKKTLIIHSSVVEKEGEAFMFLGESGTGKSTHSRLWVKNIEGAALLNDDAPIVRIEEGRAVVYGSPWSGKGCVYRNVSAPVNAIYRLSQAPYNKLHEEGGIAAFSAILPSCLPAMMEVEPHTDTVCDTLSDIVASTRHFHLECLPDDEAAFVSYRQL